MKATVEIEQAMLAEFGISITQFQDAVAHALGKIEHPETGATIYINGINVTVKVNSPEVGKTTTIAPVPAGVPAPKSYSIEE